MTENNEQFAWWDDRTTLASRNPRRPAAEKLDTNIFATPRSIYEYFDSRLYGCDAYKKALSTAIWSSVHLHTKTSFLVIGPSGCGKTELARILSDVYPNSTIFDATSCSPVSYKGVVTLSQCLLEVDTGKNALPPWIFIDEIDKALLKGDTCGPMLMNELLKMTEGGELYAGKDEKERQLVDTSRVNFVFLGTFEGLRSEQKNTIGFSPSQTPGTKAGPISRDLLLNADTLSNEFLGRINGGIIEVEPMDVTKATALLSDSRYSPIKRLEELYRININVSDEKKAELANMTVKYGVRGIYSELQTKINEAIFDDCTVTSISI